MIHLDRDSFPCNTVGLYIYNVKYSLEICGGGEALGRETGEGSDESGQEERSGLLGSHNQPHPYFHPRRRIRGVNRETLFASSTGAFVGVGMLLRRTGTCRTGANEI